MKFVLIIAFFLGGCGFLDEPPELPHQEQHTGPVIVLDISV
jgi:hypothetical protein